jgi:hypothetical protein
MRKKYRLTTAELDEWRNLPQDSTDQDRALDAWQFWNRVCWARGIDGASMLAGHMPDQFTAMAIGHGRHWCHPQALRCKRPPEDFELKITEVDRA